MGFHPVCNDIYIALLTLGSKIFYFAPCPVSFFFLLLFLNSIHFITILWSTINDSISNEVIQFLHLYDYLLKQRRENWNWCRTNSVAGSSFQVAYLRLTVEIFRNILYREICNITMTDVASGFINAKREREREDFINVVNNFMKFYEIFNRGEKSWLAIQFIVLSYEIKFNLIDYCQHSKKNWYQITIYYLREVGTGDFKLFFLS